MFSRNLRNITKTISFRLTIWYSLFLVAAVTLLFLTAYLLLYSSIRTQDKDAIESHLHELSVVYNTGGLELVEKTLRISKKFGKQYGFLVRLADKNNNTLLLSLPYQWTEFDIKQLETTPPAKRGHLFKIPALAGEYQLLVGSSRLPDGSWIQVGKSNAEQSMALARLQTVLGIVIIPLLSIGFIGGAFLSYRALKPIRQLIQTVRSITMDLGKMGARVPSPGSNDEMEELVSLFNAMLEKIEDLISAMKNSLDQVAHDLKTPMTRLRGIAEIAIQSSDSLTSCKAALGECIEETERILRLIDTLLDISEAETGTLHLEFQHVDLALIIDQVVDIYRYVAETKSIKIETAIQRDLWICADPTRIGQVLSNIVDNAVKYTPKGGTVSVGATRQGRGEISVTITDTGMGISEEEMPKIWDRLYRGDKSRSQKGLGLGLTFVKAIIDLHKGHIHVSSQPGRGTTFTISLPYSDPP